MNRYTLHALLGINAALIAVLLWMWVDTTGGIRNIRWQAPDKQTADYAAMVPQLPQLTQTDTSRFIAMLDRPVFSPNRRPPPPPPPPVAQPQLDRLSQARLLGVLAGEGFTGVILMVDNKARRIALNSDLDGWVLKSAQGSSATFEKSGQTHVLYLKRAALAAYTGVPLQPSAPQQPAEPDTTTAAPSAAPAASEQGAPSNSQGAVFGGTRRR